MARKNNSLEKSFQKLLTLSLRKKLTLKEISLQLGKKAKLLLILFLSLPFCLPIAIPGLSTLFGLAIAFIALQILFGKNSSLPKFLGKKKISQKVLNTLLTKGLLILKKTKPWLHPRITWISHHLIFTKVSALLIALLGLFLALPLPIPFTNFIPGWSLLFITLGWVEEDGLFIILGYSLTALCLVLLFLFL